MKETSKLASKDIRHLSLEQLQQVGVEHSGDIHYRAEVSRRVAKSSGCQKALLFDDVAFAVPEAQRPMLHGLPGYERALLPSLMMATGFDEGAAVIVSAPPNPVEMHELKRKHADMETQLGQGIKFQVLMEQDDVLVDIYQTDDETYTQMCVDFAVKVESSAAKKPYEEVDYLAKTAQRHLPELSPNGEKLYVSPFLTTLIHHEILRVERETGSVTMPDTATQDKAVNNYLLRQNGFNNLPYLQAVACDGRILHSHKAVTEHKATAAPIPNTSINREQFAIALVDTVLAAQGHGIDVLIKIDSDGVSGLGNLALDEHPELFEGEKEDRVKHLVDYLEHNSGDRLPPTAVVEEFVYADTIEGVPQDYTVCGMMVDGVFLPTSINPFGTTKGVYDCQWTAPRAEMLGEHSQLWKRLYTDYIEMGNILADNGYRNGQLAGDVLVRTENDQIYTYAHDFNFRRGGRSTPEADSAIRQTGLFEAQVICETEQMSTEDAFTVYTNVCEELAKDEVYPFSTAFAYYSAHGDHRKFKYKLSMPVAQLNHLPRNQHLQAVTNLVQQITNNAIAS